jgi:hypothetical protein
VGINNLLWGNDLPHPEGTFPFTHYWIRERFHDLPQDETARILGENAADLYRVDRAALAPLVEEFGPSPDEVHGDRPVEPVPV